MNAKKAKALRRLVKNLQKSQPDKIKTDHSFIEHEGKRKVIEVQDFAPESNDQSESTEDGQFPGRLSLNDDHKLVTRKIAISSGQMTVNPATKRGVYLHLKKSLKSIGNK